MTMFSTVFVAIFLFVYSNAKANSPEIYSLHVKSQILSRFANTLVTSRLANTDDKSKEAVFVVQLPNAAFISNFLMEINGKIIFGDVKEKERAKKAYDDARALGQSAGHVAQAPRETNTFHISVNVGAMEKVTFNLTYQEILERVHGVYKHIVNVQPGQIVDDLKVEVFITEAREITTILVPEFGEKMGEKNNKDLLKESSSKYVKVEKVITPELSHIRVIFNPNESKQKKLAKNKKKGIAGQLVVLYDVKRDNTGGELQVVNGYFIHFFAPRQSRSLHPSDRSVIFVLDTSGSMSGRKIEQTKNAMKIILKDLNPDDKFNILEFDDTARQWKPKSVQASKSNVNDAIKFVKKLEADGGTNINEALQKSLKMVLNDNSLNVLNTVVIFLTDGQATEGITDNQQILNNAKSTNHEGKVSVHSVGFGSGADFDLLKRLSLENDGVARKVYEDSDAALQLEGFYSEISTLLLSDVNIEYLNETIEPETVVFNKANNYYAGSEVMVVGKVNPKKKPVALDAVIVGKSTNGRKTFKAHHGLSCSVRPSDQPMPGCVPPHIIHHPPHPPQVEHEPLPPESIGGYVERMWAYMSIKKLIERSKYDDKADKSDMKKKALDLSIKYNFVTELTSMVVIQPGKKNKQVLSESEAVTDQGEIQRKQSSRGLSNSFAGLRGPAPSGHLSLGSTHGGGMNKMFGIDDDEDFAPGGLSGFFSGGGGGRGRGRGRGQGRTRNSVGGGGGGGGKRLRKGSVPTSSKRPRVNKNRRRKTKPSRNGCGANETSSGKYCEHKCAETYNKNRRCQSNGGRCKCKTGYLRSATGRCVRPWHCPNAPKSCSDPNAEITMCGKACPQKTCQSRQKKCKLCGPPACTCRSFYVLNSSGSNGKCVPEFWCS